MLVNPHQKEVHHWQWKLGNLHRAAGSIISILNMIFYEYELKRPASCLTVGWLTLIDGKENQKDLAGTTFKLFGSLTVLFTSPIYGIHSYELHFVGVLLMVP